MSDGEVMLYSRELQVRGFCFPGQKAWLESHGFDVRDFVKNGLAASKIEHFDDALSQRAVRIAKELHRGR